MAGRISAMKVSQTFHHCKNAIQRKCWDEKRGSQEIKRWLMKLETL